jgi:hypothetical protein
MTQQYQQPSINEFLNSDSLTVQSFDFRQVQALIPAGTTATLQRVKIPGNTRLSRLSWCGILAPTGGQSVAVRMYRIRPASNPSGFAYIQLNNTYTINAATFTDAGGNIDISSTIIPGRILLEGEYIACSWQHTLGGNTMQPLNVNWNFTPVSDFSDEEEPDATWLVGDHAEIFG